jgi:hypothetical protein
MVNAEPPRRSKSRHSPKGMNLAFPRSTQAVGALDEAKVGYQSSARRTSLETIIRCVADHDMGTPLPARRAL